jgi:hypothetical protein
MMHMVMINGYGGSEEGETGAEKLLARSALV